MATFKMFKIGKDAFLAIATNSWNFHIRNLSKQNVVQEFLGCPEAPKKPINSFVKYFLEVKHQYKFDKPTEALKEISENWRNLDKQEKEKYQMEYQKERVEYQNKLDNYKKSLTNGQKEKLKMLKNELTKLKPQDALSYTANTLQKSFNKPKGPPPVYMQFYRAIGSEKVEEAQRNVIKEQWKNLSDNEKNKILAEFGKQWKEYQKNLENWELKMMEKGNFDVISSKTIKELKKFFKFC